MPIRADLRHFYRTVEWFAARTRVLERACYQCETCGLKNGWRGYRTRDGKFQRVRLTKGAEPYYTGRKLVTVQIGVGHLNHTPGDDRDENLRAMCRRCHLLYDADWHRQSRAIRKDAARPILALLAAGAA